MLPPLGRQLVLYPYLTNCQYVCHCENVICKHWAGEGPCLMWSDKEWGLQPASYLPKFSHGRIGCKLLNSTSGMLARQADWLSANASNNSIGKPRQHWLVDSKHPAEIAIINCISAGGSGEHSQWGHWSRCWSSKWYLDWKDFPTGTSVSCDWSI